MCYLQTWVCASVARGIAQKYECVVHVSRYIVQTHEIEHKMRREIVFDDPVISSRYAASKN